eukprot:403365398
MLLKNFGKATFGEESDYKCYKTQDNKEILEVDTKYEVIKQIGNGATSVVVKATHQNEQNKNVAIKKINKIFDHTAFAHRAMRELKILRSLEGHDNVLKVHEILKPQDINNFNELYVVTDYMESDLHDIIRINNNIQREHKQFFMYQLLRGLKYIHSAGVIHRDIKPQNLLVNKSCDLKICDFGLATVKNQSINTNYELTHYVVTRWFRAPELLLKYQQKNYTSQIDMWSVGCVLAELYLKKVLFGEKEQSRQIQRLISLLGLPPQHLLNEITDHKLREFISEVAKKTKKVDFQDIIPDIEPDALDLLKKLLVYDPKKRLTAEEALRHKYFEELHAPEDEPFSEPISYFDFEFEQYTLDKKILRDLLLDEIVLYHSSKARAFYDQCKQKYPRGILEKIYVRRDSNIDSDEDMKSDTDTQTSSNHNSPEKSQQNSL